MSEYRDSLKEEFKDKDYREAYADDFLNTKIATQIKAIREQRGMKQWELAEKIGTKQEGISRLENVNYASWNIKTLKKIAHALGGRLTVSIETYGSLLDDAETFSREALERPTFEEDPVFQNKPMAAAANARVSTGMQNMLLGRQLKAEGAEAPKSNVLNFPDLLSKDANTSDDKPKSAKEALEASKRGHDGTSVSQSRALSLVHSHF